MDTNTVPSSRVPISPGPIDPSAEPTAEVLGVPIGEALSRRGFLRGAAIAGGGLVAATIASCTPGGAPSWTYAPTSSPAAGASTPPSAGPSAAASAHTESPSAAASAAASPAASAGTGEAIPPGWTQHDIDARNVIRRYVGDLAPALKDIYGPVVFAKLAEILGAADNYPELQKKPAFVQVPNLVLTDALQPLKPTVENGVKVFNLTIDEISQQIDELKPPVAALGYNKQWPGPTIRVNEGDKVRAVFTNNLKETTGVHFHGVEFDDFFQDGIPFVTQLPITPGETYTYEFTARTAGSQMYHSHHNATDQVGRGLLGAFVVEPKDNPVKYDREYVWISNDSLGGFTINGHGFPATVPVLAAVGETVLVRFMNEGIMMHPWHSHGYAMKVIARDGHPLGSAAFYADTLGVNPGERWDATIAVDRPGIWAFHCHILPHVEGASGMFGMVNTLIVVPEKGHVDAIVKALVS
jgi:FtsP/CotA-like multicopper oxidase with cupredoxin domain